MNKYIQFPPCGMEKLYKQVLHGLQEVHWFGPNSPNCRQLAYKCILCWFFFFPYFTFSPFSVFTWTTSHKNQTYDNLHFSKKTFVIACENTNYLIKKGMELKFLKLKIIQPSWSKLENFKADINIIHYREEKIML